MPKWSGENTVPWEPQNGQSSRVVLVGAGPHNCLG